MEESDFPIPFPRLLQVAADARHSLSHTDPLPSPSISDIFQDLPTDSAHTHFHFNVGIPETGSSLDGRIQSNVCSSCGSERPTHKPGGDLTAKEFLVTVFVGSFLWYGLSLALEYFDFHSLSMVAFFISAAAFSVSSSAFLLHLLLSVPSVKSRFSLLLRVLMREKFFVFLHHFLCVYYTLSLLLSSLPPSLSLPPEQRDSPFHSHTTLTPNSVIFLSLFLLLLTMWSSVYYEIACHLSNPGKVESLDLSRDDRDDRDERFCHSCQQVKPLRAKHCRACNICVYRFDHHCMYTNNCVGAANQRSFLIFLSVEIVHVSLMGYLLYCIVFIVKQHESWSFESIHLTWQIFLTAYCIVGVVFLWLGQLHNTLLNWTTNERYNSHRYTYLHKEGSKSILDEMEPGCANPPRSQPARRYLCARNIFDRGILANFLLMCHNYQDEYKHW